MKHFFADFPKHSDLVCRLKNEQPLSSSQVLLALVLDVFENLLHIRNWRVIYLISWLLFFLSKFPLKTSCEVKNPANGKYKIKKLSKNLAIVVDQFSRIFKSSTSKKFLIWGIQEFPQWVFTVLSVNILGLVEFLWNVFPVVVSFWVSRFLIQFLRQ